MRTKGESGVMGGGAVKAWAHNRTGRTDPNSIKVYKANGAIWLVLSKYHRKVL